MAFPANLHQENGACLNAFCLPVAFKTSVHYFILCLGKGLSGFVAVRWFALLCAKAPGMRFAFANTDPRLFTPVDHKRMKIWKGGIIARWPVWFLAEHRLFSLGDVMGICKTRSTVIHCFDSFHWPFLVPVMLCVGRCGLFLAFSSLHWPGVM